VATTGIKMTDIRTFIKKIVNNKGRSLGEKRNRPPASCWLSYSSASSRVTNRVITHGTRGEGAGGRQARLNLVQHTHRERRPHTDRVNSVTVYKG
jgi:hypothetical protein